jgi:hypothetical protein
MITAISRCGLGLGLAGLISLTNLGVAAAAPPEVSGPETVADTAVLTDCGDFLVLDDFQYTVTRRSFTDNDGNVVRRLLNVQGTDSIYNSVTGKRYTASGGSAYHIDPATSEQTITGVVFRVNVPGAGAVLLDIGRSTSNPETGEHTFIAGPHELLEGDIASLCAALA